MRRTIQQITAVLMLCAMFVLSGCGSSGDAPTTKVSGTAAKGIIFPGKVVIYAVNPDSGDKISPSLATLDTDAKGQYSADLGSFSGSIQIEAFGTYTDEATGNAVVIDAAHALKALVAEVSPATSSSRYAVTPLTDLAATVAKATLPLTPAAITAANARISELFKISDILSVQPVAATPAVMADAATTAEQRAYTLALATISKMAGPTVGQLATLLTAMNSDLQASSTAVLSQTRRDSFAQALADLTHQPDPAVPGDSGGAFMAFTSVADSLKNAGSRTMKLTMTALPTTSVSNLTVSGTINLPAGSSVRTGADGALLPAVFACQGSGIATLSGNVIHFQITIADGFVAGSIASLVVDVTAGTPLPADYIISNIAASTDNVVNNKSTTVSLTLPLSF